MSQDRIFMERLGKGRRDWYLTRSTRLYAEMQGAAGREWLRLLPDLLERLEQEWSITVVESLPGANTAFVGRALTPEGQAAVLKVAFPPLEFTKQIRTLERARGRGYARALKFDYQRGALLQEALGSSIRDSNLQPGEALEELCTLLKRVWELPPEPSDGLPVSRARQSSVRISERWADLKKPCSTEVLKRALGYAANRARLFDPNDCVLVHGDAHGGNALQILDATERDGSRYTLIDPEPFLETRAFDLDVALSDCFTACASSDKPLRTLGSHCALLSDRTGVDASAIWEWGYIKAVSTGLFGLTAGWQEFATPYLSTAERVDEAFSQRSSAFRL